MAVHSRWPVAIRRPRARHERGDPRLGERKQFPQSGDRPIASRSAGRSLSIRPTRSTLYTMQCSLDVTAKDLAVMGATLADGGVNPLTRSASSTRRRCKFTLAVMATAGLYETSGDWLYDVGLPGKSGIGGGIVTVSPGKGGFGAFAPRLDDAGNSVKGQLAARLPFRAPRPQPVRLPGGAMKSAGVFAPNARELTHDDGDSRPRAAHLHDRHSRVLRRRRAQSPDRAAAGAGTFPSR